VCRAKRVGPRLGFQNHRQFRGVPGGEAAGHFDYVGDPILVQDAGGDGRAVAARAMNGNAAIAWNFSDALLQMVEWNVHAAIDMFRHPLNGVAGGLKDFEAQSWELERIVVLHRYEGVFHLGAGAEMDGCAATVAQFQMAGDKSAWK